MLDKVLPHLGPAFVEVLFADGEGLGLTGPEVAHAGDDVEGVADAEDDFINIVSDLFSQWIVSLNEPSLIIGLTLILL